MVILDGVTYEPHVPFGQITGWTWANGQSSHRSYDANGQMTAYSVGADSRTLRYDTVNNLNSVTGGGVDQEYAYDRLARLTAAQSWTFNPRYTYDANGNRTLMTEGNTTIPYALAANSNRLTTVGGAAYTYDANGNVLADGRHQYGYSARNRLIRVDADDTATYAYNALGQRVYKNAVTVPSQASANKKITRYVYDGARLLGEYRGDGAPVQEIVWLGDTPVAVLQGNQVYYVHTDSLGAPRALTDAQARVVWRWDPRPFGDSAPNEDPDGDGQKVVLNLRFPGQYYDLETGLHYNYYRYYDPSTGRYITSDPIGLNGGLNTYAYVTDNPLNYTDPKGQIGAVASWGLRFVGGGALALPVPGARVVGLSLIAMTLAGDTETHPSDPLKATGLPPGYWPGDKGAEEWGRRHGVGAKEGRRRFHGIKQGCPGSKAKDVYGVDPDTGDVVDPEGEVVGNLDGAKAK